MQHVYAGPQEQPNPIPGVVFPAVHSAKSAATALAGGATTAGSAHSAYAIAKMNEAAESLRAKLEKERESLRADIGSWLAAMVGTQTGDFPALDFLRKLQPLDGQTLDASRLTDLVGAASENGVGPRLAAFRRTLEASSPPVLLNEILIPTKKQDGTTLWTVRFPPAKVPSP